MPSAASFRQELRAFLAEHHPGRPPKGETDRLNFEREWAALLADAGWAAPAWPKEWGGMGLPAGLQLVYHEEMARARVPAHPSPNSFIVGPAILRYGTPEQKERFLRPIVRADELWCQGFSEPGAGSDLAALTTRAVLDGDEYVVTGQKVWTSRATGAGVLKPGWNSLKLPADARVGKPERYWADSPIQVRGLRLSVWTYRWDWFRGRRLKPTE